MSRPLRVLIVEDSEDDALLLLRELRRGGYDPSFERVDTYSAMISALSRRGKLGVSCRVKVPVGRRSAMISCKG